MLVSIKETMALWALPTLNRYKYYATGTYKEQFDLHDIEVNQRFRNRTRQDLNICSDVKCQSRRDEPNCVQPHHVVHYGLDGAVNSHHPVRPELMVKPNYALSTAPPLHSPSSPPPAPNSEKLLSERVTRSR